MGSLTFPPYSSWELVLLHHAASTRAAVCLDGSPAGYFIERGTTHGWLMHLQGGGWCTSLEECEERARGSLGSSASYATDRDAVLQLADGGVHGLFSNDSDVNPAFHAWTKVML